MDPEKELEHLDQSLTKLDKDTIKTNRGLLALTRWITILTFVMILVGIIQLVVMWPKRTYCVNITSKVQVCEPDYYPFDANPSDNAYKLDKALGND